MRFRLPTAHLYVFTPDSAQQGLLDVMVILSLLCVFLLFLPAMRRRLRR